MVATTPFFSTGHNSSAIAELLAGASASFHLALEEDDRWLPPATYKAKTLFKP